MQELNYPYNSDYILKKKQSLKKALLQRENINYLPLKIAILGGATTNDIKLVLELFLLNNNIKPSFYESEYNKYYEDAMFPNPVLESFDPDLVIFCTCNRNITEYPSLSDSIQETEAKLLDCFSKFEEMWNHIAKVYHCPIIQNNFEFPNYRLMGSKDASDIHGKVNFITRLNMMFYTYAQTHENFYIHDINYESAAYGLERWSASFYWHMYKYAVCIPAIPYFSYNLANIIKSIYGKNKKVLMLDLDNTLWGGIIGDDGVDNIEMGQETSLGQTYCAFQEYIKAHKQLGVLLTINSKNDLDVALSGFKRPDSCLKEEDFAVIKANWDPKSQNLLAVAEELSLLPESFVFVDDNPAEREIVRNEVAGAAVPEMTQVEQYIQTLDKAGYFEVTNFSKDDLKRNEMYQANAQREKSRHAYANYEEYLISLQMRATIKSFESTYMSRISQLTNKSNQFNLTTKRYNQNEIEAVAKDPLYVTLYGKLEDKFGDNGVVSVIIGEIRGTNLHLDLWIMSCRVLKRDLEYAMMDQLIEICLRKRIRQIVGYYYPTVKNSMVKNFYQILDFTKVQEDSKGNTVWQFNITNDYNKKNRVIKVN